MSLWSGRAPRRCQVEAFAAYVAARDAGSLSAGVFAAATGSGKSILLAEVVADQLQLLTGPSEVCSVGNGPSLINVTDNGRGDECSNSNTY